MADLWNGPEDRLSAFVAPHIEPSDRLSALSRALLNRGYFLDVRTTGPSGLRIQDITVLSAESEAISVRRRLRIGAGARVVLTEETYATPGHDDRQRWASSATELRLERAAEATVLTVHAPDHRAIAHYDRTASIGPEGRMTWIWTGFGGYRTKIRNSTTLDGPGGAADDLQTFFGEGEQSYDSGIQMNHVGTDTHGQSITRGLFRDQARGMSRGLVRIEKEARKTLSYLSEHAMLLSKGARSDTIPILEILCRDVKATHSSSVAPVDPEKVFYLESRGLEASRAIRMIGEGFLSHVLDRAPIPGLRETLYPYLADRWEGRPIRWGTEPARVLPTLAPVEGELAPEWRFDAKLR
jgi:Fe-S cluster assembly scaffold protein SufB